MGIISVDSADATVQQLLVHLLDRFDLIDQHLNRMENRMTDLTASVDALKGAVDGVAQRLLPQIAALEASLAQAVSDDAEAAVVLADANAAAAAIRQEVDRLNALGADPTTPVDPAAPDADVVPDVEVPTTPDAPVEDPDVVA